MKIDILRLRAFGPFTDKDVDFSGNGHGLHIVFGPNEAGKSTALRAMLGLLYGFGHTVEDAWLHDYKKLEVGGVLRLSDGKRLNLTRHKRRKNDLIDDDTEKPVDQRKLDAILGKMERQAFEHAFGISHHSLRKGVESVLAAGGELGQALFAATTGLNTLKQVMAGLEEKQNGLFKPRAQKAAINADISELERLNKEFRAASGSRHHWKKMQGRLDDLCAREAQVTGRLETMSSEISLLSRHRDALKHVTRQVELQKKLAALGFVPDLPEDFARRRVEVQVRIKAAEQTEQNLNRELSEIERQIETLSYDERVIAHAKMIAELAKQASVHTTALADMKKLRGEIYRHDEDAEKNIGLLRAGLTLEGIEALRLSTTEKAKIQRMGQQFSKLEEASGNAGKALEKAEADLAKARKKLDNLDAPKETQLLEDCLDRASGLGKIEEQLSLAQLEHASALEQVEIDLAALGLFSGDLDTLEKLAIPAEETMRNFETELSGLDQRIEDLNKEGARMERELKENRKALSELAQTRELPSLEDLQSHRALRERGWRSVRSVWLAQGEIDQGFMDAMPQGLELADAYEKAVSIADDTSDALRNDAEDVARAQALKSGIQDLDSNLVEIRKNQADQEKARAALSDEWINLWHPIGIAPLKPRDMAAWAARVREIRRKAVECRKKKNDALLLKTNMERMAGQLTERLKELSVPVSHQAGYSELFELAKHTKRQNDQCAKARQSCESEIAGYERQIKNSMQRKDEAWRDMEAWKLQWTRTVGKLGFGADAAPEDVNDFVLALDQVFAELEKAREKQQRIAAMQTNFEKYATRVNNLLEKLAPDLKSMEQTTSIVELHDRLAVDQSRYKERKQLEEQAKKRHGELANVMETLAAEREKLRLLCADAQTDEPDNLPEIEERAASKRKLLTDLSAVNERLSELASGQELAVFVADVQTHDPDELIAKIGRLDEEKKGLMQEQKQLLQDIALQKRELETIGGQSLAAGIAETAQGLAAKIQTDVEHYIRLKLATVVLAKAIERYRQKNQNPVLDAAGGYFTMITIGAFDGLRADYDEKGDPIIKAIRQDGRALTVREMSDGSRDQLFLALRLGGLEKYISNNGPMPFIVDDVLVHFDDDRSAAAFAGMGRLAQQTQVIFFTHHQHLVDLAKATLSNEILSVHYL